MIPEVSILARLDAIESARRPGYKVLLSRLEGTLGHAFYRRSPPSRGDKRFLHLGCGDHRIAGWVNADYYRFSDLLRKRGRLPDWMLDAARPWRCETDYWDGIHSEHTLEHLDYRGVKNALSEAHRTLKPGQWMRIVLPCVEGSLREPYYVCPAEAIAHLAHTHGHLSVWDTELLCAVLGAIGFREVRPVSYGQGSDPEIVQDLQERAVGSLHVEARK